MNLRTSLCRCCGIPFLRQSIVGPPQHLCPLCRQEPEFNLADDPGMPRPSFFEWLMGCPSFHSLPSSVKRRMLEEI